MSLPFIPEGQSVDKNTTSSPHQDKQVNNLRIDFENKQLVLEQHQRLLKAAQYMKLGRGQPTLSADVAAIQERLTKTNLDSIITDEATQVRIARESALSAELPYTEAAIFSLREEISTHLQPETITEMCVKIKRGVRIDLQNSDYIEILRLQSLGKNIEQLSSESKLEVQNQLKSEQLLTRALALKNSLSSQSSDYEVDDIISQRLQKGESIDQIIQKTISNIEIHKERDRKRRELVEAIRRSEEVTLQLAQITRQKENAHVSEDQQKIVQARSELTKIASEPTIVEKVKDQAFNEQRWIEIPDIPQPKPGYIRLYRGVKAIAIQSEFADPPSENERQRFDSIMIKGATQGQNSITEDERAFLKLNAAKMKGGTDKFYSHNYQVAQEAANNCIVYFIDVPSQEAQTWMHGNWTSDTPCVVPWNTAKTAEIFSIGPGAPQMDMLR